MDTGKTWSAIERASPGWLAASLALGLLTFFFRAVRWVWILRPVARVKVGPAFSATAAGFAANNLPGKVGEVLRPYLLSRTQGLPFSPLLASILLERVFDGASVIFFFLVAIGIGLRGMLKRRQRLRRADQSERAGRGFADDRALIAR